MAVSAPNHTCDGVLLGWNSHTRGAALLLQDLDERKVEGVAGRRNLEEKPVMVSGQQLVGNRARRMAGEEHAAGAQQADEGDAAGMEDREG